VEISQQAYGLYTTEEEEEDDDDESLKLNKRDCRCSICSASASPCIGD